MTRVMHVQGGVCAASKCFCIADYIATCRDGVQGVVAVQQESGMNQET
jgi:hypothetical protein